MTTNRARSEWSRCRRSAALAWFLLALLLVGLASHGSRATAEEPLSGPRELFALYNVDESLLAKLRDGTPIGVADRETLLRVLFVLANKFTAAHLDEWSEPVVSWSAVAEQPGDFRGRLLSLAGRVRSVAVEVPPPEAAERFNLPRYYRCEFELEAAANLADGATVATIYTPRIPEAWITSDPKDARSRLIAAFLKQAGHASEPHPVLVAQRVGWYPEATWGEPAIDVSLFDDVVQRSSLSPDESECFYQLLAAMGQADPSHISAVTDRTYELIPLLEEPESFVGQLRAYEGVAQRINRVAIDDPEVAKRLGFEDYYQIEVSLDLERPVIDAGSDEAQPYSTFPAVFSARRIPQGMPTGDNISERVRVAAVFLKLWEYRSEAARARSPGTMQIAPLFIAAEPNWVRPAAPSSSVFGAVAGVLFLLAMAGIWWATWRGERVHRAFARRSVRASGPPDWNFDDSREPPPDDDESPVA